MRKLFAQIWRISARMAKGLSTRCKLYYFLNSAIFALAGLMLRGVLGFFWGFDWIEALCYSGVSALIGFFAAYFYAVGNL